MPYGLFKSFFPNSNFGRCRCRPLRYVAHHFHMRQFFRHFPLGTLLWPDASCRSKLRSIMHLISAFSSSTHRASIPPTSVSLLGDLHFFSRMHHVAPASLSAPSCTSISVFSSTTHKASIPPSAASLLGDPHVPLPTNLLFLKIFFFVR